MSESVIVMACSRYSHIESDKPPQMMFSLSATSLQSNQPLIAANYLVRFAGHGTGCSPTDISRTLSAVG